MHCRLALEVQACCFGSLLQFYMVYGCAVMAGKLISSAAASCRLALDVQAWYRQLLEAQPIKVRVRVLCVCVPWGNSVRGTV